MDRRDFLRSSVALGALVAASPALAQDRLVILGSVPSLGFPFFVHMLNQIKAEAVKLGALGCGISGSGPTIFALSTDMKVAADVGKMISSRFSEYKLESDVFYSRINLKGARIIEG